MSRPAEDIDLLEDELLEEDGPETAALPHEEHEHWRIVADKGQSPIRIDKFLMDHLGDTSRNRIQKAAEAGCIRVDGRPVKSNYKVKPLEVVTLVLERPKRDWEIVPEDIPLDITYEDDQLMVINKPAGLVVHPGCGNYSGTLVNALAWHLRDNPDFDPNDPDVGLVHRIDKDTSGLLVIAKTPEAKTHLCHQFFVKTTRRQYNALVWGSFAEDEGRIEGNIGALSGTGTFRTRHTGGMPPRDGAHPSDTRPHEAHRSPALQRRTLWRRPDTARRHLGLLPRLHTQLLRPLPPAGAPRPYARLRPSRHRRGDVLHLSPAPRHDRPDREVERPRSEGHRMMISNFKL